MQLNLERDTVLVNMSIGTKVEAFGYLMRIFLISLYKAINY